MNDQHQPLAVGDRFVLDDVMHVEVTQVRHERVDGRGPEVEYRAVDAQDAIDLGWGPVGDGQYEAVSYLSDFLIRTTPIASDLEAGTSVQWIDPRTGEPDPTPGRVTRILPDPSEAYPIEVQFTDGLRGRYARSDLKVVAL